MQLRFIFCVDWVPTNGNIIFLTLINTSFDLVVNNVSLFYGFRTVEKAMFVKYHKMLT